LAHRNGHRCDDGQDIWQRAAADDDDEMMIGEAQNGDLTHKYFGSICGTNCSTIYGIQTYQIDYYA
jgi:hypothetical protein